MTVQIIAVTVRSITVERMNNDRYESTPCTVLLNGKTVKETVLNVISIFGLDPDTGYELTVREENGSEETLSFRTQKETLLLNVKAFGAKGDGVNNDTSAIQAAIACCPAGGTVYLPKGTYCASSIFAKSDMTFWLDQDAVLLGLTDRTMYPILPGMVRDQYDNSHEMSFGSWEGNPLDCFAALLSAIGAENLTVIGEGVLNGNADQGDWWVNQKVKRIAWRPRLLFLNGCRNVVVQGITVKNSPSWTVHPYYSCNLKFLNLHIENPYNSPNTDGFDPESCTDVLLLGTRISVGDDCIAIKSGKLYMATAHRVISERIEIRNCSLESGHGSVTIGSEIAGGVQNVHVTNCRFLGTDRGVRIKTRRGRGETSVLTDLVFENIRMEDVKMPITVNMHYFCDPDGHSSYVQSQEMMEKDYRTPTVGTIALKNVECSGVGASLVCACGLPESPIVRISLEQVEASYSPEAERKAVTPIMMDGFDPVEGESLWLKNVSELNVKGLHIRGENVHLPEVFGAMERTVEDFTVNGREIREI